MKSIIKSSLIFYVFFETILLVLSFTNLVNFGHGLGDLVFIVLYSITISAASLILIFKESYDNKTLNSIILLTIITLTIYSIFSITIWKGIE